MPDLRKAECVESALMALSPRNASTKIRECRKILDAYEKQVIHGDVSPCICEEMGRVFVDVINDARKYSSGRPHFDKILEELVKQEN